MTMTMIICKLGDKGVKVRVVQRMLHLVADGEFGNITDEAVKDFQKKHGLVADGIVGQATWKKLIGCQIPSSKRAINDIIIHCSATPEGRNFTVADITRWHKEKGYATIGYHYVIYLNGEVKQGRDINLVGAHCLGHNTNSIGICYVGGCDRNGKAKDTRTKEQKEAMEKLVVQLLATYPSAKVHGHHDYDKHKDCPCFDVKTLL